MLNLPTRVRILLCATPVDLRKSFDGLCGVVESVFERQVLEGHLFLFLNKRRDRLKALWWEEGGLVLWYKRLERGTFEMPVVPTEAASITLDATALAMLLGGVPLGAKRRRRFQLAS